MTEKTEPLVGPREIIGALGLSSLALGVAQIWWPLAPMVVGVVLLAVAFGYLK